LMRVYSGDWPGCTYRE